MPTHPRSLHFYPPINLILSILLPAIGILQGSTTVFYIVYLFWWQELLASILDGIFYYRWRTHTPEYRGPNPFWARLFLLFIYFTFIIVLFGLMSSLHNDRVMALNIEVFVFRNWIFNISIIGILLNEFWMRKSLDTPPEIKFDPFGGRMIVLHISIILGGLVLMALSRQYPNLFSEENLWGAVLTATPFLLLKAWFIHKEHKRILNK